MLDIDFIQRKDRDDYRTKVKRETASIMKRYSRKKFGPRIGNHFNQNLKLVY